MTLADLRRLWEQRRTDGERLGALVPLALVATEVLSSLRELQTADDDVLSIGEAALLSGYSPDHLRKEIAAERIPNAGRKGKPAIRRADVPRKPGHTVTLPSGTNGDQLSARRRIVRDAITPPPRSA